MSARSACDPTRERGLANIDDDGDLDFVVTTKFGAFYMIRNNFNGGNWLKVRLTSPQGQAGAFGSKVRVFRAGTTSLIAMREAKNMYGYLSHDDPVIDIGLGADDTVDVEVTFLDGSRVTRPGVSARQTIAFFGGSTLEAPGAPGNLMASIVGNAVTITWNAPSGGGSATSYVLEAGSAPGLSNLAIVNTATRSLSAIAPAGTYYVRVRARSAVGSGSPSNEIAVVVGGGGECQAAPGASD